MVQKLLEIREDTPNSFHIHRNTAMFLLPVDQHFIKKLNHCSPTFRSNFFLLIYGEVLEIKEEASNGKEFAA